MSVISTTTQTSVTAFFYADCRCTTEQKCDLVVRTKQVDLIPMSIFHQKYTIYTLPYPDIIFAWVRCDLLLFGRVQLSCRCAYAAKADTEGDFPSTSLFISARPSPLAERTVRVIGMGQFLGYILYSDWTCFEFGLLVCPPPST